MKRIDMRIGGLLLAVLALGLVWQSLAQAAEVKKYPAEWFFGEPDQRAKQDALVGKPAPDLNISDWENKPLKTADTKDKIIVLDFWATWCGPCLASIPHNNELYKKYKDKGVLLIGICGSENGQEKMHDVVKEKQIEYPVACDTKFETAKKWLVMWWPTYAVIDRQGVVRALGLNPDNVENVLDDILAQEAAAKTDPAKEAPKDASKETPKEAPKDATK